ncbi:hypothetical protein [Marinoscillum furvescens]|uniref:Uncharacterized protein n=1 Tax=Marinoscillum furvescens DSM 4134 TaxID=1122208 RepID=A0A3D9KY91_MARFU|nr:hypothetical protein [Marinoscillum furvescens]RED94391.1 hypothetical protein C7460_12178 [Marinoscillum furvescens DSM 4134]
MKASTKIIVLVLTFVVMAFVVSMFVFRAQLQQLLSQRYIIAYEELPLSEIRHLKVNGPWDLRLEQQRDQVFAFDQDKALDWDIYLKISGDTLILDAGNLSADQLPKIQFSAPVYGQIETNNNTSLYLVEVAQDSLRGMFRNNSNIRFGAVDIQQTTLRTEGGSSITIIRDIY